MAKPKVIGKTTEVELKSGNVRATVKIKGGDPKSIFIQRGGHQYQQVHFYEWSKKELVKAIMMLGQIVQLKEEDL